MSDSHIVQRFIILMLTRAALLPLQCYLFLWCRHQGGVFGYLMEIVTERGYIFTTTEEREIVRDVKADDVLRAPEFCLRVRDGDCE